MNTVRNIVEIMFVLSICLRNVYIIINDLLLMSTIKIYSSESNYLVDVLLRYGAIQNILRSKLPK